MMIGRIVASVGAFVLGGSPPAVQHRLASPEHPSRDSVLFATITTDTGALAPGNTDFARFSTPGMCLGAVGIAKDVFRRSVSAQLAHVFQEQTLAGDSLPEGVVHVARACASRFTVLETATGDLPDLFRLALMAEHDSLARAVVERRLTSATTVEARAVVLHDAVDGYLSVEPARLAAAESALAQLDALGAPVQEERIRGHQSLLSYLTTKYDALGMRREAERIIALGRAAPAQARQVGKEGIFAAYTALTMIAYLEQPDSIMLIAQRAKQDLSLFGAMPLGTAGGNPILVTDFSQMSVSRVRDALLPPYNANQYAGTALPPLTASYWFPKPPDRWPPGNGQPSLVIYGGWLANACARSDWFLIGALASVSGSECGVLYSYLPHWAQQYGARLVITLVSQIAGEAARSVVLSPAEEADSLNWFFREHLQLPITLGVAVDSVWHLPRVDGRIFRRDTSIYGNLTGRAMTNMDAPLVVLFYGAQGTLQYVGDFNVAVLHALIARAIDTPPSVPDPRQTP